MKTKKQIYLIGLLLGIVLLIVPQGWAQPKPEAKGPIITNAFAVEKGYYGSIWRIYIEAEDPDAEMVRIAVTVDQVGYGHYPTDWIYLKRPYRNRLKGYLQWNTFSSKAGDLRDGVQITLKVSIVDKAGNESKELVFPFTFESGMGGQPMVPAPFDQGDVPRLGYINIDLISPDYKMQS